MILVLGNFKPGSVIDSATLTIFTHLKLCLATVTDNLKWQKIRPTHICLIWDQTNFDV